MVSQVMPVAHRPLYTRASADFLPSTTSRLMTDPDFLAAEEEKEALRKHGKKGARGRPAAHGGRGAHGRAGAGGNGGKPQHSSSGAEPTIGLNDIIQQFMEMGENEKKAQFEKDWSFVQLTELKLDAAGESRLKTAVWNQYTVVASLFTLYSSCPPTSDPSAKKLNVLQLLHMCAAHKIIAANSLGSLGSAVSPSDLERAYWLVAAKGRDTPFATRNETMFGNAALLSRANFIDVLCILALQAAHSGGRERGIEDTLHDLFTNCQRTQPSASHLTCSQVVTGHLTSNGLKLTISAWAQAFARLAQAVPAQAEAQGQYAKYNDVLTLLKNLVPNLAGGIGGLFQGSGASGIDVSLDASVRYPDNVSGEVLVTYSLFLEMVVRVAMEGIARGSSLQDALADLAKQL